MKFSNWQERTELLLGAISLERLATSKLVVVGVGGVGAAAAEMLVRAGVGTIAIIDSDAISLSNINRQLPAYHSTIGMPKVEVMKSRLLDINPQLNIFAIRKFVNEESLSEIFASLPFVPDYVLDAIDTLSPKIALIQYCLANELCLVSSMGSGAKMDATRARIADISKTRMCPLAHMLRKRLHKLGIREGFLAVYSEEEPIRTSTIIEESQNKKSQVGTISYLPTVFGCICAQAIIKGLIGQD